MINVNTEASAYYNALFSSGAILPLNLRLNIPDVLSECKKYDEYWQIYNKTTCTERFGLPITSLNGDMLDELALTSLRQYNRDNGTDFGENSFKSLTNLGKSEVFKDIVDIFGTNLSRSHVLKLNKGGFFPPHRDNLNSQTIRVLCTLNFEYAKFFVEDKIVYFEPGRLYAFNGQLVHYLFSFANSASLVVFNIEVNRQATEQLLNLLI